MDTFKLTPEIVTLRSEYLQLQRVAADLTDSYVRATRARVPASEAVSTLVFDTIRNMALFQVGEDKLSEEHRGLYRLVRAEMDASAAYDKATNALRAKERELSAALLGLVAPATI